ncbi:phage tail protein [Clostridium botulinum]|uniref:phage tail protein n=2 Tax=Clostridium botulinum TaxID=1491 RepID=UPI00016B9BC9|nr:phage tail protein [Clostridium botulinum]APC85400.1 phage tail-collar fiber family protein [Clostridium botulinum]AXG97359.1 phage tail protein [Clostridium botulinum]EDT81678.1 putative phage tail fiber protein [Clostridium botulinum NCTC 2916]MBY6773190.1 phage tail protein [Clostridium botulinum]MBY6776807.1 phage tail protein [Clostridium botulinum]
MAEKFYTLLTEIGKAKIANSAGFGSKVNFVKMKVGDGGGTYYNPTEGQEDLVNTVYEGNINYISVDEENPNWINIEMMIPANVGGFMIREYGIFDEENNMLGVAKCPETYKPVAADGSTKELLMRMNLEVSNTQNVTLKIDPTIIFAKKSDLEILDNKIKNIKIPVAKVNEKIGNVVLTASDIKTENGQTIDEQLADITTDNKRLTKDKTITGAINELFTSASNGKTKVATAITGKGVPASGSDSYDTLSSKIKNIKTGYTQNDLINAENVEFSIKNIFSKNMDSGMLFFIKDYIYVINWKNSIKKYSLDGNLILSKKIDHNGFSSGYYTYFDDIYKIFFHNNSFYIFNKGLKHSGEYYYRVYAETCDIERISAYDFGGQGAYSYYGYGGVAINNDGICCGYNEYSGEVFLFSLSYADVIWSKCLFGWNTKYDFSNIFSDGTDFYISSNSSSGSYYKINVNGDITKLEKKSLPYESNSVMLGEYVYWYDSNKKIWRYNIKTNKTEQIGLECKYIELDFLRKYLYIYTGSILHKIDKSGNIICSYNCTDDHFLGSDKDGCIYFYNNNVINKIKLAYKVLV